MKTSPVGTAETNIAVRRRSPQTLIPHNYLRLMAHTHACNLVHCVFSTKDRANLIPDPERLWQCAGGIARQKQILLLDRTAATRASRRREGHQVRCTWGCSCFSSARRAGLLTSFAFKSSNIRLRS